MVDEIITNIAQRHLIIDDLIEVGNDEKDVLDCPKACIREALREAFYAGLAVGSVGRRVNERSDYRICG
jgi:hypothetical protein